MFLQKLVIDRLNKNKIVAYLENTILVFYKHELASLAEIFACVLKGFSGISNSYEAACISEILALDIITRASPSMAVMILDTGKPFRLAQSFTLASLAIINMNSLAQALPTGYQSVAGDIQFTRSGSTLNIQTQASRAIARYQQFDIASGETVNFQLPSSQAAILNSVVGGNPSQIMGAMHSNGQVFLVNPAGILFGQTAQVNVGSLFASTMPMDDQDFLAGQYVVKQAPGSPSASIVNKGAITIQKGGYAVLAAGHIQNAGTIMAPQGHVDLAVGSQVTMAVDDNLAVAVTIDDALKQKVDSLQTAISNTGTIRVDGGIVQLQANLNKSLYEQAINNEGIIEAQGFNNHNGEIIILANRDSEALVLNSGTLDVSGTTGSANGGQIYVEGNAVLNTGNIIATGTTGGKGGEIRLLGDTVALATGSLTDATGDTGGGTILVGGNIQGQGIEPTAQRTIVAQGAQIKADALSAGDGGTVVLWSDEYTGFQGTISARGGSLSGNGGFVETSSHDILQSTGLVDASAAHGKAGQWLLDPNNITIQNAGVDTNVSSGGVNPLTYTTTDDSAIVTASSIQSALNLGTSVTIQTSTAGVNTQSGDITVAAGTSISKTTGGDATLSLVAHNSILFNGASGNAINLTSTSGKLNIILNSDSDAANGGAISLAYTNINTNGGNVTMGGGADPTLTAAQGTASNTTGVNIDASTINTGAGNISILGTGYANAAASNLYGVVLSNGAQVTTTSGTLAVMGTGGAGTDQNYGVYLNGADALISSQTGDVTLTGQGGNGSGSYNIGLVLQNGSQITSTGSALLNLAGTGGTGTNDNCGILINGTNSLVSSQTGNVTVTGQGGNGSSSANIGLVLQNGGQITSTGSALLNLTGTGGAGTDLNYGVLIEDANSLISSQTGNVTLTGQGGNGSGYNYGVYLASGGQITSTGSALLNLAGTGGTGINNNTGISLDGTNSLISSQDGNVTLTGQGGNGSGFNNTGLVLTNGGQITSTSSALLNLTGIGGTGTSNSYGVYLYGTNSLISSQTGNVTLTGQGGNNTGGINFGLYLESGGQITSTGSALLNLVGTGGTGTSYNYGVLVSGTNALISSQTGNVTLTGQGGGDGSGVGNDGLYLTTGGQITSTGSALLSLAGTGGTGTDRNFGVRIDSVNSLVSSQTGNVTLTGQGGNGSGSDNYGLYLESGGQITSTGSALLNLTGTGGTGTSDNDGVYLYGGNALITSVDGDVTLMGQGGNGSGSDNYGLYLEGGGRITSTGTALLNLSGTGGAGTLSNHGVFVNGGGSLITSLNGDVTITAQGGNGSGTDNRGLFLYDGGQITSTGTALLNLSGTGGAGTSANYGVFVLSAGSLISSVDGDITVTGQGGNGSGVINYGLYLFSGGQITSTGTALLNLSGTGGAGVASNFGVFVSGAGSLITSLDGNVTLTGQGGNGSGSDNYGLYLNNGGQITSTGTALLNLSGTGGTGTDFNYGVYVTGTGSLITSLDGDITLTGQGGNGSGSDNYGLYLESGGQITSTGTALLNLSGTGGTGVDYNLGVYLSGAGALITSLDGDATITGQGGNGTGSFNYGVLMELGTQITSTGTALLNVSGTGGAGIDNNIGVNINTAGTSITSQNGDVTITGVGGNGTGINNYGAYLHNGGAISSTSAANITVTATGGNGATDLMSVTGGNIIGDASMLGDISLYADSYSLSNLLFRTAGNITFAPRTASTTIGVNGGAGSLQLGNSYLDLIDTATVAPSKVIFGNNTAGSGAVDILGTWDVSSRPYDIEVAGGSITTGDIDAGSQQLTLHALTGDIIQASGTLIADTVNLISDAGNIGSVGTRINTQAVNLSVNTGNAGNAYLNQTGAITLKDSSVGNLFDLTADDSITVDGVIQSQGSVLMVSPGDITLNIGKSIQAQGAGNSLVLASTAGNFINNAGAGALSASNGRWLVYSGAPALTLPGGLTYSKLYNKTYVGNPPGTIPGGDSILYRIAPILTVQANHQSNTYGSALPVLSGSITGFIDGDTAASATTGSGDYSTSATASSDVGNYTVTTALGTLASGMGYQFNLVDGTLAVTPASLTVRADNQSRLFGSVNPALTATYTGFVLGQNASVLNGALSLRASATPYSAVGSYSIRPSGLTSSNYIITFVQGTLNVEGLNGVVGDSILPVINSVSTTVMQLLPHLLADSLFIPSSSAPLIPMQSILAVPPSDTIEAYPIENQPEPVAMLEPNDKTPVENPASGNLSLEQGICINANGLFSCGDTRVVPSPQQ